MSQANWEAILLGVAIGCAPLALVFALIGLCYAAVFAFMWTVDALDWATRLLDVVGDVDGEERAGGEREGADGAD